MKQIVIYIMLTCVMLLGITNCVPTKKLCQKCPTKDSITYVETVTQDTNYTIPDSLFWQMSFECDSAYNVLLSDFTEVNSGLNTDVKIKEVVRTVVDKKSINILTLYLNVKSDSIQTLNRTIEKLKNTVKTVTIEKEVPVYRCRKFFIYCTIAFFVCIILTIGWIYLKYKAKILSLLK